MKITIEIPDYSTGQTEVTGNRDQGISVTDAVTTTENKTADHTANSIEAGAPPDWLLHELYSSDAGTTDAFTSAEEKAIDAGSAAF